MQASQSERAFYGSFGRSVGQVQRWREQLAAQGHAPDQVERLVVEYRAAAVWGLRERARAAR